MVNHVCVGHVRVNHVCVDYVRVGHVRDAAYICHIHTFICHNSYL